MATTTKVVTPPPAPRPQTPAFRGPPKPPIPADRKPPAPPPQSDGTYYSQGEGKYFDAAGKPVSYKPAASGVSSGSGSDYDKYVKDKENSPASGSIKTNDVGDKAKIEARKELLASLGGTSPVGVISDGQTIDRSTLQKKAPGAYGVRDEDGNSGNKDGGSGITAPNSDSPKGINFEGKNVPAGQKPPAGIKLDGQTVQTPPKPPAGSIIDDKGNIIPPTPASQQRPADETLGNQGPDQFAEANRRALDSTNEQLRKLAEKDQQNARAVEEARNNKEVAQAAVERTRTEAQKLQEASNILATVGKDQTSENNAKISQTQDKYRRIISEYNEEVAGLRKDSQKLEQQRDQARRDQSEAKSAEEKAAFKKKADRLDNEIRDLGKAINETEDRKKDYDNKISNLEATKNKIAAEAAQDLKKRQKELEDRKTQVEKEQREKETETARLAAELSDAQKDLDSDQRLNQEERKKLEKRKKDIQDKMKNGTDKQDRGNISLMSELLDRATTVIDKLKEIISRSADTNCVPCKGFLKQLKDVQDIAKEDFEENREGYQTYSAAVAEFPTKVNELREGIAQWDKIISQLERSIQAASNILKEGTSSGGALANNILKNKEALARAYAARNAIMQQIEALSDPLIQQGSKLVSKLEGVAVGGLSKQYDDIKKELVKCESEKCDIVPGSAGGGSSQDPNISNSGFSGTGDGTLKIILAYTLGGNMPVSGDSTGQPANAQAQNFLLTEIPVKDKDVVNYQIPSTLVKQGKPNAVFTNTSDGVACSIFALAGTRVSITVDFSQSLGSNKVATAKFFYNEKAGGGLVITQ